MTRARRAGMLGARVPDFAALLPPAEASLLVLLLVSFLAATLVPLASEVWLLALLAARPDLWPAALAVATVGNTAGSLTTYALGRLGRVAVDPAALASRRAAWLRRRGTPVLLLAWLPFVGDALCLLAGWLALPALPAACWIAAGKLARYAALVWLFFQA
ncbi:YqaA family protein [Nannocystis punicea]|uniref:DedA family protein n=1 Tax=Nannocystis punicea TaxID=2995304 RepID=A0ABY7H043_9BACT|nr:DedA family protein [Nannocystis poenicansa]WAS92507.1 DedA family protein [Nannocystis poenicansa]